jgi:DNA-binding NarL/FixJ family response regulator
MFRVSRISVLAVDDHEVFADALQAALSGESDIGPVAVAYNAVDAAARVARTPYDVAVVDYLLGDETGAALTAQIRASAPKTKVIILSAAESIDAVVDALVAGVSGWLPKLIDIDYLVRAIRGVHAGEMWIDRALLGQVMPLLLSRMSSPAAPDPFDVLTSREREVLDCMIVGLSRAEIAEQLQVSPNTVRTHTQNLISKLGAHSSLEVVTMALRAGYSAD